MHNGDAVEGSAFDVFGSERQQKLESTRRRLGPLARRRGVPRFPRRRGGNRPVGFGAGSWT